MVPFRLLYILPGGRAERLQLGEGKFPDEFFYGYCQLVRREGWQAELKTRDFHSRFGVGLQKLLHWFTHLSPDFGAAARLNGDLLRRFDAIVSMSEPVLFMLALRKRRLSDGAGLVLIEMGADKRMARSWLPAVTRRMLTWLYGKLAAVIVIGEGERDYLLQQGLIEPDRLHLVQFGVDTKFWVPAEFGGEEAYVLAVGNDDGRDYETLLKAIGNHPLRLHTARPLDDAILPPNVIRTRGDWSGRALSDEELRDLYRESRVVVTPLRDSTQPQGQSVTLQAMACGKAVILSRTRGLWSRGLMRHMDNCYLVPPGDVAALREAIDLLQKDAGLRARLGKAARQSVERHFSSDLMGDRIGAILERLPRRVESAC
jgi:glycosyltransferase involved in cell wall biosynthesis